MKKRVIAKAQKRKKRNKQRSAFERGKLYYPKPIPSPQENNVSIFERWLRKWNKESSSKKEG